MSEVNQVKNIVSKNSITLALFAMFSTASVSLMYQLTKDRIASEEEKVIVRQLDQLVSSEYYDNLPTSDCILLESQLSDSRISGSNLSKSTHLSSTQMVNDTSILNTMTKKGNTSINKVYRMRLNSIPSAAVISSTSHDGYSGDINFIVAISVNKSVLGVEIVSHTETPGLGDKIESSKSQWLQQFTHLQLEPLKKLDWQVKKDGGRFDALTGATITPRSIVNGIQNTIEYFNENEVALFREQSNCFIDGE